MSSHTKKELELIIAGLNSKLEGLEKAMEPLKELVSKVTNLETLLKASKEKCDGLTTALEAKDKQVDALLLKLNAVEQHNRSWSVRINGVHLTGEEETNVRTVKEKIYEAVLKPILEGAREMGDLDEVPDAHSLIEHAHVLPAKDNAIKPIIARFTYREYRSLVFRHKKAFAPRERTPASNDSRPGRFRYPLFEDLTKMTFAKMRALATHPRVEACWSSGGQLRFKMKDSQTVHRVNNLLATVEAILPTI